MLFIVNLYPKNLSLLLSQKKNPLGLTEGLILYPGIAISHKEHQDRIFDIHNLSERILAWF